MADPIIIEASTSTKELIEKLSICDFPIRTNMKTINPEFAKILDEFIEKKNYSLKTLLFNFINNIPSSYYTVKNPPPC